MLKPASYRISYLCVSHACRHPLNVSKLRLTHSSGFADFIPVNGVYTSEISHLDIWCFGGLTITCHRSPTHNSNQSVCWRTAFPQLKWYYLPIGISQLVVQFVVHLLTTGASWACRHHSNAMTYSPSSLTIYRSSNSSQNDKIMVRPLNKIHQGIIFQPSFPSTCQAHIDRTVHQTMQQSHLLSIQWSHPGEFTP